MNNYVYHFEILDLNRTNRNIIKKLTTRFNLGQSEIHSKEIICSSLIVSFDRVISGHSKKIQTLNF